MPVPFFTLFLFFVSSVGSENENINSLTNQPTHQLIAQKPNRPGASHPTPHLVLHRPPAPRPSLTTAAPLTPAATSTSERGAARPWSSYGIIWDGMVWYDGYKASRRASGLVGTSRGSRRRWPATDERTSGVGCILYTVRGGPGPGHGAESESEAAL